MSKTQKILKQSPAYSLLLVGLTIAGCTGFKSYSPQFEVVKKMPTFYVTSDAAAEGECATFSNALLDNYYRNYIEVPEDWDNPGGRKIKVFYYGQQPSEGKELVIFFNGGPGSSSHAGFPAIEKNEFNKVAIMYMDQRGTGCSDPFPIGNAENLSRLKFYGSRSIVLDAEAIRKQILHGIRWKVLGQSYGGDIVYRYLETAPEGLSAAFIHGSTLSEKQSINMAHRVLSQKRVSDEYFAQFPEDRAKLDFIRTTLPSDYCISNRITGICGPAIMDGAIYLLAFKSSWNELHNWLHGLIAVKPGKPDGVYDDLLFSWAKRTILSNINFLLGVAISELESVEDANKTCEALTAQLKKSGTNPDLWPFNECRIFRNMISEDEFSFEDFKGKDPMTLGALKKSLDLHPDIPVHVFLGKYDSFVPIEGIQHMTELFKDRIQFTVLPESGHEGFLDEKIWADLVAPLLTAPL